MLLGRPSSAAIATTGGSRTQARRPLAVVRAAPAGPAAAAAGDVQRRDVLLALPQLLSLAAGAGAAGGLAALLPAGPAAAAACELAATASGLSYCDIRVGDGDEPVKGALIRCNYTGRLASNNRVFDSSEGRRPLTFKIGVHEVITGWDLGILGADGVPPMKEGGKRLLLIPSELAYGSRGAGGVIPPNADLLFEVELLGKRR